MFLEKQYQLGEEVTAAFGVVIHSTFVDSLRQVVTSQSSLPEALMTCVSPQELIKFLPKECFCLCLRQVETLFKSHMKRYEFVKPDLSINKSVPL